MRRLAPDEVIELLEHLTMLGWLQRGFSPDRSAQYLVNPAVHEKFAEVAKAEAKRCADSRKMIAGVLGRKEEPEDAEAKNAVI